MNSKEIAQQELPELEKKQKILTKELNEVKKEIQNILRYLGKIKPKTKKEKIN